VYDSQPPAFLLLTEPGWALLGGSIAAARAVMVGWALVGVASGAVIGWRLAGPVAGISIAAMLAVEPMMVQQSVILQADGPATALGLLAVAMATCALKDTASGLARCSPSLPVRCSWSGAHKLLDAAVVPVVAVTSSAHALAAHLATCADRRFRCRGALLLPISLPGRRCGSRWSGCICPTARPSGRASPCRSSPPGRSSSCGDHPGRAGSVAGLAEPPASGDRRADLVGGALVAVAGTTRHSSTTRSRSARASPCWEARHSLRRRYGAGQAPGEVGGSGPRRRLVAVAAIVLVRSLGNVQQLETKPDPAQVASIQQLIPSGSQLFGDDQFNEALAGRQGPPYLIDTSVLRLHNSGLTPAALESRIGGDPALCGWSSPPTG